MSNVSGVDKLRIEREQIKKLERLLSESKVMIGIIAHDTKTPIASAITGIEAIGGFLHDGYSRSENQKKYPRKLFLSSEQRKQLERCIDNISMDSKEALKNISHSLSELRNDATASMAQDDQVPRLSGREKLQQLRVLLDGIWPVASTAARKVLVPLDVIKSNFEHMEDIFNEICCASSNDVSEHVLHLSIKEYDDIHSWTRMMYEAIENCEEFIEWILEALEKISITYGNSADEQEVVSVGACISGVVEEYSMNGPASERIIFRQKDDFEFMGPAILLRHVLLNLLNNALEYTDSKIEIWAEGNTVHVKDYGEGMEAWKVKNIFKSFASYEKKGTGIGLAFCNIAMKKLGGSIECDSKLGEYTEFTLRFPKCG